MPAPSRLRPQRVPPQQVRIAALVLLAVTAWWGACTPPETAVPVPSEFAPPQIVARDPGDGGPARCESDDACQDGQACCAGFCVTASRCESLLCARQGAPCLLPGDLSSTLQEDFVCARLSVNQPDGVCLRRCEAIYTGDVCAANTLCLPINTGGDTGSVEMCIPGECRSDADCASFGAFGGTCLPFGNGAAFCLSAGAAPVGAPCDAVERAEDNCASGLYCEPDTRTCMPLCDVWGRDNPCPVGSACGFLTRGAGVCSPRTETGRAPFEPCAPARAWCSDGVECLDFATGGDALPVCTPYCRPTDPGDCQGPEFGERASSCRTVFSDGEGGVLDDIGLCF